MDLHIPTRSHDKIAKAVTRSDPVDLLRSPQDRVYVTLAQKKKIQEAVADGKRDMTLSAKS